MQPCTRARTKENNTEANLRRLALGCQTVKNLRLLVCKFELDESDRKSSSRGQTESQVTTRFQLTITCNSVWPGPYPFRPPPPPASHADVLWASSHVPLENVCVEGYPPRPSLIFVMQSGLKKTPGKNSTTTDPMPQLLNLLLECCSIYHTMYGMTLFSIKHCAQYLHIGCNNV